jgi:hypothetical protein
MQYSEIMPKLAAKVPELNPIYEEHRETYNEYLPHVIMGEIADFIIENSGENQQSDLVNKTLDFLEDAMSSDNPRVPELITVSFLEALDPNETYYQHIEQLCGRRLRASLEMLKTA